MDDDAEEHEEQAEDDETALGRTIAAVFVDNQKHGADESEGGTQVGGDFALGEEDINQGSDAVHEQADGGVHFEEEGDQHGAAEHGKEMLQTQRNVEQKGRSFLHLDNAFFHNDASDKNKIVVLYSIPAKSESSDCSILIVTI